MTDTNFYYSMLRSSIMWLEKYIEVAQYYSDWKQRKQTDSSSILWVKEDTPKSKVLHSVGTVLTVSFEAMLDEEPLEFREELKKEFYKWLDTSQINVDNAPVELKCALFDFHEILECRFEKAQNDRASRKREIEIDSPEYMKKLQELFSKSQEAIHSGKANQMDDSPFKGNPEIGKETFLQIANSLSKEERENFHFWPQKTNQEKMDRNRKNQEPNHQIDPVLQSRRAKAISKITFALTTTKLTKSDLKTTNQNWESRINQSKDLLEIANIEKTVLTDIAKKKKKWVYCHTAAKKQNDYDGNINNFYHLVTSY